MELAPGAELIGWDVTAFGLPAASLPFALGSFCQHIEMPGVWLERARIDASDTLLMDSPLGLAGQRCMASIFFVAGSKLERNRRQQALDVAREVIEAHALRATAGATSPDGAGGGRQGAGTAGRAGDAAAQAGLAGLARSFLAAASGHAAHLVDVKRAFAGLFGLKELSYRGIRHCTRPGRRISCQPAKP